MGSGFSTACQKCCKPAGVAALDVGGSSLFQSSCLFVPPDMKSGASPMPGIVLVHGACFEAGGPFKLDYPRPLAEELARLGVLVLMIRMPDNNEDLLKKYPAAAKKLSAEWRDMHHECNVWPAAYYSEALSAAIDHLCEVAPARAGVGVDPARIALVGHSMGGAGVLYAAGAHCKEKIAAVVSLNPSHIAVDQPLDRLKECTKYHAGKEYSGEFGYGKLNHLVGIKASALVYGSLAEYNANIFPAPGTSSVAACWPSPECVYDQIGKAVYGTSKELYVDHVRSEDKTGVHVALFSKATQRTHADGVPFEVICSFVRRQLCGSSEPLPTEPAEAKAWKQQGKGVPPRSSSPARSRRSAGAAPSPANGKGGASFREGRKSKSSPAAAKSSPSPAAAPSPAKGSPAKRKPVKSEWKRI